MLAGAISATTPAPPASPITVGDLVRFAQIGDPQALDWRADARERAPGVFSPDGTRVAVVVGGGDPQGETNNATLWVYYTAELMLDATPIKLAEFASSTPYQPIALVRWLADNETLVFAGTRGADRMQVYEVNIRTRELRQLTSVREQFIWYGISADANRLLTLGESTRVKPADDPECQRYGCRVSAKTFHDAERGEVSRIVTGAVYDVASGERRALINPESVDDRVNFCDPEFSGEISPDGRYAIRLCRFHDERLPEEWGDYSMSPQYREAMARHDARSWRFAFLVDLQTGRPASWTQAPTPRLSQSAAPIWIDGGRQIIFPSTFESLANVTTEERARRARSFAVQLLDIATLRSTRIGRLDPKFARTTQATWDAKTQTLTVQGVDTERNALPAVSFQRKGKRWMTVSASMPEISDASIQLAIEQSLNDPPVLVAIDRKSGARKKILDPNPWLAQRKLGKVEAIQWQAKNGKTWHGGLYYPPDYQSGKRYAVLIQTHGFQPERFSLHGIARNFPGQALAAHGVVILQVDENDGDEYPTPQIWANSRAGYEGAIDHLDGLGLIDRTRVGTVGWSATGPTTATMFTHSDYPIAAAAFTDSGVFGWWYHMAQGDIGPNVRFGGAGYGPGLSSWLEQAPTFNLERMRTPLLMWAAVGVSGMWDWYAGLRSMNKPVELWSLPTGTHDVYQASQLIRTNQLLVDWFRFWLKDEEDRDDAKAEQYRRWREFRKQQAQVLKQPRPPALKWTAAPIQ